MTTAAPRVSVVMPVFNGAAYLAQAMDSILAQTLPDWELIVIDDGSTDASASIAQTYSDPRIRLIRNPKNLGLPVTRNRGIDEARNDYIAFLDSDDVALPHRLQMQVEFLDANLDIAGVGASAQPINGRAEVTGPDWRCPGDAVYCKATLLFRAYFVTSSFTARTEILRNIRFDPSMDIAEDYDLYNRLVERHRLINLRQTLIQYRAHGANVTTTRRRALREAIGVVNRRQLAALGIAANDHELQLHRHIEWLDMQPSATLLSDVSAWLLRLLNENERHRVYDSDALRQAAASRWHAVCEDALRKRYRPAWPAFYRNSLCRAHAMALADHLKLSARLLVPRRPRAVEA